MKKLVLSLFLTLTPIAFASTWYVDGVNGNDNNDCKTRQTACKTIGHAISLASSGDTIGVGPAIYQENLTIGISLKVIGSGASTTIIDGGHISRVVTISSASVQVTLARVTIQNGSVSSPLAYGGGIYNSGMLTINNSTVTRNSVIATHYLARGGGIYNAGSLTINNSTLSANTASRTAMGGLPWGGGIFSEGNLTINTSTLSGNLAESVNVPTVGGAILNYGTLSVSNSTFSGNSAKQGGGIDTGPTTTFQNNIVSGNSGGNCAGTITSNGYNLSSDATCNFSGPGDLNNTDPKLGPLQNNGGPTQTQALLSGSPAIDAGNPNGCTDGNGHLLKTDQRGAPRPDREDNGGCDMGAFERASD